MNGKFVAPKGTEENADSKNISEMCHDSRDATLKFKDV